MSLAHAITSKTDHYAQYLLAEEPFMEQLRQGTLPAEAYAIFLENIRYLVNHTPKHLKLAISASEDQPELKSFFEEKFLEEQGHDEWAKDDLKQLAKHTGASFQPRVTEAMKSYVTMIAQAIEENPQLYPPYIYYTERLTVLVADTVNEAVSKSCNFGEKAATILTEHAELDQYHIIEGEKAITELVDEEKHSARTLQFLDEIIAAHKSMFLSCLDVPASPAAWSH